MNTRQIFPNVKQIITKRDISYRSNICVKGAEKFPTLLAHETKTVVTDSFIYTWSFAVTANLGLKQ